MKFFRLLKGELNKILMRPILYVITGILVIALFFSYMLFNPAERTDGDFTIYNNCETLSDVSATFNSNTTYGKPGTQSLLNDSSKLVNNAKLNNESSVVTDFQTQIDNIIQRFSIYKSNTTYSSETDLASPSEMAEHQNLLNQIENLEDDFETNRNLSLSPVLVTSSVNSQLEQSFFNIIKSFKNMNKTSHKAHIDLINKIEQQNSLGNLKSLLQTIKSKKVSEDELTQVETCIEKSITYLSTLETQINEVNESLDNERVDELKALVGRYYLVGLNINNLAKNITTYSPILDMTDAEVNTYFGYGGVHTYQIAESITYQKYLANNNAVSTDFANVFSPTRTSNGTANAFDFVYFGLEIISFIVIIFTVVISAGMLAGEQTNGTLKLLLIRPYSRNKILTSKLLASLIFASIFLLFSTIVLFLIGLFTMGANFTPMLCIFNATSPFVVSPVVTLLIYLLCLMFKVFIYILLSLAISAIFRSNVAAVGISIVLYFLLSIFGTIFSGSYWYGFLPLSNLDLFKYFGGAFIATGNISPISIIFSSPMFYGGSFLYSILITLGIGLIIAITTYLIFKKREIK